MKSRSASRGMRSGPRDSVGRPAGVDLAEAEPIFGDFGEGDVVAAVDEADEERFLGALIILAVDDGLEGGQPAGGIGGGVFLDLGVEHFEVFATDGLGEEIIGEGKEGDGAEGEDEGVPEAEADADAAERVFSCMGWILGPKHISHAAEGMDAAFIGIDLAAESVDQDIDHVGLRIEAVVEDVFEDHGFGHHPFGLRIRYSSRANSRG
jgi:hypothetical protein